MKKVEGLQELLNKKAEERATEEIEALITYIRSNDNIQEVLKKIIVITNIESVASMVNVSDQPRETRNNLRSAFWCTTDTIPRKLIKELTAIYIPIISKEFLEKVDEFENYIK